MTGIYGRWRKVGDTEWAEVPYVPARRNEKKDSRPYRYVAIRVKRQQGELFEDAAVYATMQ